MINELKKMAKELELRVAREYFVNESICEKDENNTEYIGIERVPYEIGENDNFITELERELKLDWNVRLELDTESQMIVVKYYSTLW